MTEKSEREKAQIWIRNKNQLKHVMHQQQQQEVQKYRSQKNK